MPVVPPRPKDLPLNALRAFEAAARLGGFSLAASELGVSPGAVSAHIKQLEDILGAQLFNRSPRGVVLTPLGVRVSRDFSDAFDALALASHRLRAEAAPHVVHIATLPAYAQLWLSSRLPDLRRIAPEISVSITAMETPPTPNRSPYDLCLFPGMDNGRRVAWESIFPVCSPPHAARLSSPTDLLNETCLSDTTWADDWTVWFAQAAPDLAFAPRGPVFSLYALALEETINGAGILMGHSALVQTALDQGLLVAPFETRVPLKNDLRLWPTRPLAANSPARRVSDWLAHGV